MGTELVALFLFEDLWLRDWDEHWSNTANNEVELFTNVTVVEEKSSSRNEFILKSIETLKQKSVAITSAFEGLKMIEITDFIE